MMNQSTDRQRSDQIKSKGEIVLKGRAVSRGVGIGKVLCLYGHKRQFYKVRLTKDQLKREVRRFLASVRLAKLQLKKISQTDDNSASENLAGIFETHLLFLEDKPLLTEIEKTIKEEKVNAEWAVKIVIDAYVAKYKLLTDKHLREKYIDLEDIAERLLTALGGGKKSSFDIDKNTVIVAKELNPSTLIELNEYRPKAIITERGGWTSHTFILAREFCLPAVTGLKGILRRIQAGDEIIVDGFTGQVTLKPEHKTTQDLQVAENEFLDSIKETYEPAKENPKTLDGVEIAIRANSDMFGGYERAKRHGAKGIGLYRSEFLFNQNRDYPSEEEQIESYSRIGDIVGVEGVRIRTFDLSVDQLAVRIGGIEKNPALGLRAIRLSLLDEIQLRTQLRALLRASFGRHIDIVLPMTSDVSEILRAKEIIKEEKTALKIQGIQFGNPKLGAMIEVPAAVFIIDKIVEEVDFVSLGTNDLVQYLLAVDRDNEDVADWFRTLHPAVLRSLRIVIEASNKTETPVIICGEMAGSPLYVAVLIGLGATEMSMNLNSIPRVRKVIKGIAFEEAREIVKGLEICKTADEIEESVRQTFSEKWAHLFSLDSLPIKNV